MSEEKAWINRLSPQIDLYYTAVMRATQAYTDRVIAALNTSDFLTRNTIQRWSSGIDFSSINEVTEAIAAAYMSGKTRATLTLPRPSPPASVGFRADDMDAVNSLRELNTNLIRKFSDDMRIIFTIKTLERQSRRTTEASIKEELKKAEGKVRRIAETEVMRVANLGRINEYQYRGVRDVQWVSDSESCQKCQAMNKRISSLMELPPLPLHPQCKCTVTARY